MISLDLRTPASHHFCPNFTQNSLRYDDGRQLLLAQPLRVFFSTMSAMIIPIDIFNIIGEYAGSGTGPHGVKLIFKLTPKRNRVSKEIYILSNDGNYRRRLRVFHWITINLKTTLHISTGVLHRLNTLRDLLLEEKSQHPILEQHVERGIEMIQNVKSEFNEIENYELRYWYFNRLRE